MVGAASAGYAVVHPDRPLQFPKDFGAHPEYRTEWWYVTGWLLDEQRKERGFQLTFFRVRTRAGEDNPSRFAPRQLVLAHAAVADPTEGHLLHDERSERAMDPLAGASEGNTHAWSGSWELVLDDGNYRARAQADSFEFDLKLAPSGPPVPNGKNGFSQKAPDPRNASHYYSRPQLAVTGTLRLRGKPHEVTGRAWLDHEWSSEYLPVNASGWDWIGVNLHDGSSLMAFRMRGKDGAPLWAAATLAPARGVPAALGPDKVRFVPVRRWRSPRTGADYPVAWNVEVAGRTFRIEPLMDDQELDSPRSTGAVYWEGAVRVYEGEREVGRGYLEMTGYVGRLRM
ncbi:MAG TPA: carotenoid 1,2-hydratase [Aromatoleum sp.]|nr:carotenoid 1,2-hydratase [Aromatoleum sp.]HJV27281.1 carotenoid 1,2-hydratase [Aromatoleum sp.]